jgi:hypothetical protein
LLEPPFEIPRITESMQWHIRFEEDPGSRWLRELILSVASQVTASA